KMGPPRQKETIDRQKVDETAPFDNRGGFETGDNEYEVVMTLEAFNFNPGDIEVPVGSTAESTMTSKDVVHGMQIVDTNENAMILPGHIQTISHTFNEPGEYLILCNEYCGSGHQLMNTTMTVK